MTSIELRTCWRRKDTGSGYHAAITRKTLVFEYLEKHSPQWLLILGFRLLRVYWFLRRPDAHGSLVAIWHNRQVLLVKNTYRQPLNFPGGGHRSDESPLDCACRELEEEVGIRAQHRQLHFAGVFESNFEYRHDRVHVYELFLTDRPTLQLNKKEISWARFIAPAEALKRPLSPTLSQYLCTHPSQPNREKTPNGVSPYCIHHDSNV